MFLKRPAHGLVPCLCLCVLGLLGTVSSAYAQRGSTRDALDRLEEVLELRQEDGVLDVRQVLPALLVSASPRYEESQNAFKPQVLSVLVRAFGQSGIRSCEACMRPRVDVQGRRVEQVSGPVDLPEVIRLDDRFRGESARAKTAVWVDESTTGVSIRIVDLNSGRVVFAQNVDPMLESQTRSERSFRLAAEIERRNRGESLTHAIFDASLLPRPHVGIEWADQWGAYNEHLSGVVFTFVAPVAGLGAAYYRVLDWNHMMVGGKLVLSLPTVLAQSLADDDGDFELLDPTLTGVFVARLPFGNSNYAGLLTLTTDGAVGLGISLLNTSLIPVLP